MREVCFKAKRKDNGEWVEGFYFCMTHDDGRHTHHFILPVGADLSLGTPIEKIQVEIDVETLCQFTGLADKRGNKIWENDVVRYYDDLADMNKQDLVKWNETHASFVRLHESKMGLQYLYIDECIANRCEVIGNTFDNPELLNATETIGKADNGGLMSAT